MPTSHIKKGIKTQHTRKNNKRGGVRGFKAIANFAGKRATNFDIKQFNEGTELELTNIETILIPISSDIIPNYSLWTYYKCNPINVLITITKRVINSPLIPCIEGIFNINGYMSNGNEFILIKQTNGHSSIFRSSIYTFFIK